MKTKTELEQENDQLSQSLFNIEMNMEEIRDQLSHRNRRPLIHLDRKVVATLIVIAELAFKAYVIYALQTL